MESGQPREAREPGPGAETAAVPRWEEAKTFYDNLSPKKKPKSVKADLGFGGHGNGHFQEGVSSPLKRGLVEPLPERTRFLRIRMCRAVGSGSSLFWELCSSGGGFSPHPGLRFHASIPPPMPSSGAYPLPSRQPGRADRTCWQSWSATEAAAPWAQ